MPLEFYKVGFALSGVLTAATVIGAGLQVRATGEQAKTTLINLNARIWSWWIITLLVGGAIFLGRGAVIVLFALISFSALRELLTISATVGGDRIALFTIFFAVLPIQYGLVWADHVTAFAVFIPVVVFFVLPALSAIRGDTNHFLARTAEIQWAAMLCIYCISYVPAMLKLPGPKHAGLLLMVFFLIISQASDVLQYIVGKLFGRRNIALRVSPSKTAEGLIGGLAGAAVLGGALRSLTPFTMLHACELGLLIAILGFFGGLVLSAVKRDRGVKDWGRLIPGHGGLLDRIDSICFSAPLIYHLICYFSGA